MTGRGRLRAPYVAGALLLVVVLAGAWVLFVGGGSTTQPAQGTGASSVRRVARPAGRNPSESARMVCAPEAQKDLASALGVATLAVYDPRRGGSRGGRDRAGLLDGGLGDRGTTGRA